MSRRPVFVPENLLSAEIIVHVQENPGFTTAQLRELKRQVEALRQINLRLRAARNGGQLPLGSPAALAPREFSGGGRHGGRGGGRGGRGGRGGCGTRRLQEEEEEDDRDLSSLINDETEEEAATGSEEEEEDDFDTEASTSTEEAEEDEAEDGSKERGGGGPGPRRAGTARPRRTAAARAAAEGGGWSNSDDMEIKEEGDSGTAAGPAEQPASGSERGGRGGGGRGRRGRGSRGGSRRVELPRMKPVKAQCTDGEEEGICGVCGDGEGTEENPILLCEGEGCSVAVHINCYGLRGVPEGSWLCDACAAGLDPAAANCCCCPIVGSALRKVETMGNVVAPAAGRSTSDVFLHLADALWTPEITVGRADVMDGLSLALLPAERVALRCELCDQGGGAVVQCAYGRCCRAFHVLCGRAAGQVLTFRLADGEPLAFCETHSAAAYEEGREALQCRGPGG